MIIIFASNLKKYRIKANFSKAAMARKLNLKYTTYNNYEAGTGEPKIAVLINIADLLNVSLDTLLGRTSPAADEKPVESMPGAIKGTEGKQSPIEIKLKNIKGNTVEFELVSNNSPPTDKSNLTGLIDGLLIYKHDDKQQIKFKLKGVQNNTVEFESNSNYCMAIDKDYLIKYLHELDAIQEKILQAEKQKALQAAFIEHLNNLYSGCIWRRYGEPLGADISSDIERGKVQLIEKPIDKGKAQRVSSPPDDDDIWDEFGR